MSSSRTVPPRARTNYQRRTLDDSSDPSDESPAATPPVRRGATQQSASYSSSGFHVIPPDPSKHAKLRDGDRRETERFQEYTEVKRRARNSQIASQATSQPLGGEHLSPVQVDRLREAQERRAQADAKLVKYRKMREREERQAKHREIEDGKLEMYKQQQREKAVRLGEKKRVQAEQDREDIRSKRLAYFTKNSTS